MQFAILALFAGAAMAAPQAVTADIPAPGSVPGCAASAPGRYTLTTVNATTSTKRDLERRQSVDNGFYVTLNNGVMLDEDGYTAYIASNQQFQFDKPPQAGAIYTGGFALCPNETIAIGGTTIFWSCISGAYSNLYYTSQGEQCSQVFLSASMVSGSSSGSSSAPMSSSSVASVSTLTDGQPTVSTSAPASTLSQTSDHQPQAPTSAALSQTSDHQPQAPTVAGVSQTSDHQPQAPTMAANYSAVVSPAAYTAGAAIHKPEVLALAAGAVALLF